MNIPGRRGFSALEMVVALVIVGIMVSLAVHPISAFIRRLRMQNAANGICHFLLNARARAVANPMEHCAVVFSMHSGSAPDSVWAFLDKSNPPNGVFNPATDEEYQKAYILRAKDSIQIVSAVPSTIVFRGDGSANKSCKVVIRLFSFVDTIDVLASTGRIKVIPK